MVNNFNALKEAGKLEDFVSHIEDLVITRVSGIDAMCDLLADENGTTYSYPVRFVKEEDGQWRLDRL